VRVDVEGHCTALRRKTNLVALAKGYLSGILGRFDLLLVLVMGGITGLLYLSISRKVDKGSCHPTQ
jgi:hypothetical protein